MIWFGGHWVVFLAWQFQVHMTILFIFRTCLNWHWKKKALPKRRFESVKEFESYVASAKELIFDGTENLTERPQDYDNQKDKYSGKKHSHTDIALVLSDKATKIYYVSKLYNGSQVDMGLLKKEFPPGLGWFKNFKLLVDLGFIGIDKLYKIKTLVIGEKRPRKSKANPKRELSKEQKDRNTEVSRERIFVEHAIGRMKKYRILKNRCRLKCQELKNRIIGICAGLSNYQLALSYWLSIPNKSNIEMTDWTYEMLAKVAVSKNIISSISSSQVGRILKNKPTPTSKIWVLAIS